MWKYFPIIVLFSCGDGPVVRDQSAIRVAMTEQQKAWNAGDIKGFMSSYSDTICFISSKGTTCGKEGVTANYERSYPDKAAMGQLNFGINEVVPVGNEHAWVTGTWALARTADTLSGGFSLLWTKERKGWRIVRDHTY
ncbi:MAG: nuclear transport factor 2 family protein [Flavobacteriales bacterium]|nr:nuclear transport factor 2 family protein [Flavobacteriales bacterium]MBK6944912.1 nuclear transport factor 2 family protein [Flavobacteriales bacterium]MBK7239263.1 nuclear transport factor 2 family protein [Flavobacteriales bacterium]MBK7297453.1 nuclear transport factor 2 family protein [Flavobacteriales bacterium]MBK9535534.1 nuclear transport factor 2 family protein [Flavobacteriales bacterium]